LYRSHTLDLVSCIGNAAHRDPYPMEWPLFEVHFQDDGGYLIGDEGRTLVVDPNHVEIRWAGASAMYSRPAVAVDRGTSIRLPPGLAFRLVPGTHPASGCLVRPLPGRLFEEWRSIRRTFGAGVNRAAAGGIEDRTIAMLGAILRTEPAAPRLSARPRALVERVKQELLVHVASPIRLPEVARLVGYSPHHLGRIFFGATGWTIHRYLTELRLRLAAARIEAGADNFSSLALGLGFSSHSHFTTTFRARFGCPPARFREL
jgi:AraC-like DNA-binding protein